MGQIDLMDVNPNSFIWAISKIMKSWRKIVWHKMFAQVGSTMMTSMKAQTPFLREDDVSMLSTCLRCGKRKNMQLFMNHVEVEFTCNGCKNITNCIMHPYAFSTWAYFNRSIPNGSLKLNSCAMDVKTSQIASCIPMHLVHGHILIDAYPMDQWVEHKCIEKTCY